MTILGGGPAGLGAAFYAARAGRRFVLYERSGGLGGMCRTFQCSGHRYDAGAHRLHDRDPEITADLRRLLGGELRSVRAPSQVWTRGRFVDFPPTPLNAALSYGIAGGVGVGLELVQARLRPRPEACFEDFACNRFGATLAQELLLNYSEKLWGLPAGRLSPDVATRRLQGMTLGSLLVELLWPGRKARHVDGEFLYPRLGYGAIAERMTASLPAQSLRTGHEVVGMEVSGGLIRRLAFKGRPAAAVSGRVVATLPVTVLVELLGAAVGAEARAAAAGLRFRTIRLVFLRLDQARVGRNASIYIPDSRYRVSRVYEPKNRSEAMAPEAETALVAEVPCFAGDAAARLAPSALAARVVDELSEIGLLGRERVVEWRHHELPFAYPVYSLDYCSRMRAVRSALARIGNLDILGRAGAFCYSHLHDQLRSAKDHAAAWAPDAAGEPQPAAV